MARAKTPASVPAQDLRTALERLSELQPAEASQLVMRIVGASEGLRMASTSNRVYEIMLLRELKERKAHEALGVTWEEFCTRQLGRPRRTVDDDIQSLNALGEEFMLVADNLSLGRRALQALRRLPDDERPKVLESGEIEIDGRRVPLDPEHKDEIRDLLDTIVAGQEELKKQIELGRQQLEEREDEVAALAKRVKELEGARPEGITEFDTVCAKIWILLGKAVDLLLDEAAPPTPESAAKWIRQWKAPMDDLRSYAFNYPKSYELDPETFDVEHADEIDREIADAERKALDGGE